MAESLGPIIITITRPEPGAADPTPHVKLEGADSLLAVELTEPTRKRWEKGEEPGSGSKQGNP